MGAVSVCLRRNQRGLSKYVAEHADALFALQPAQLAHHLHHLLLHRRFGGPLLEVAQLRVVLPAEAEAEELPATVRRERQAPRPVACGGEG